MHAHPTLVLNADFQPLSCFPLSFVPWDRWSRRRTTWSRSTTRSCAALNDDAAAVSTGASQVPSGVEARSVHAVQCVPARPLSLPVLR
jgi:hypothetical protein